MALRSGTKLSGLFGARAVVGAPTTASRNNYKYENGVDLLYIKR